MQTPFQLVLYLTAFGVGISAGWVTRSTPETPAVASGQGSHVEHDFAVPKNLASSNHTELFVDRLAEFSKKQSTAHPVEAIANRFEFVGSIDPQRFPEAIAAAYSDKSSRFLASDLLERWAVLDTPSARNWFAKASSEIQEKLRGSLVEVAAATDAVGTLKWLEELPVDRRAWLDDSRNSNPVVMKAIAEKIGPIEPDRAFALLAPLGDAQRKMNMDSQTGVAVFFAALATKIPEDAARRALALPTGAYRSEAVTTVATHWARKNPGAARVWVETIDDAALGERATAACANGMALDHPREAVEWIASMNLTARNKSTMNSLFSNWGIIDPEEALRGIDSHPAESGANEYVGAVLGADSFTHPEKSLKMMLDRLREGRSLGNGNSGFVTLGIIRNGGAERALKLAAEEFGGASVPEAAVMYSDLVNSATAQDPEMAAAWALKQSPGAMRSHALEIVAERWAAIDRESARAWCAALPIGEEYDKLRIKMIARSSIAEMEDSMEIINSLSDPKDVHKYRLGSVYYRWRIDPKETEAWLAKTLLLSSQEREEAQASIAKAKH